MPGLTWPPRDTDRNRFLVRGQAALYGLVTVYFFLFALASGAFVPWAIFTVALAATVVAAVALLLMRAQRHAAEAGQAGGSSHAGGSVAQSESPAPEATPGR